MKLSDRYDGSNAPFQGDRALRLQRIPANARIQRATATVTPIDATRGVSPFAETIRFNGTTGDLGATKTQVLRATGAVGWVEVDFHGRRTLAGVRGMNLDGRTLQVDLGGAYVEVNANGGLKAPGDTLFTLPSSLSNNFAALPALAVTKFKLTNPVPVPPAPPVTSDPDVTEVTIRSVPTNLSLRFGETPIFWTHVGELAQPEITPDFTAALQAFLADAKVENGFSVVPLVLHSDSLARLTVALEIEFLVQESALPKGLDEVVVPFDFSGPPKAGTEVITLAVPPNSRLSPRASSARVTGVFDGSRIVYNPTERVSPDGFVKAITPEGTVEVSASATLAQPISLARDVAATAIDLLLGVKQTTGLQLDLREDLDGKPGNTSLLPQPVNFELTGPEGLEQKQEAAARSKWVSVPLPTEFQFKSVTGTKRYWLVLQSIVGEAAWSVAAAPAAPPPVETAGMQRSPDGGLSWREAAALKVPGPLGAFFRLRRKPERFEMPIALRLGSGDQTVQVSLDRFRSLGRVDFALDFEEIGQALEKHLAKAAPATCPETEHLVNGDFEKWLRIGDEVITPTIVNLDVFSTDLAIAPDGSLAYTILTQPASLKVIDVACNKEIQSLNFNDGFTPNRLAVSPDGARAYLTDSLKLLLIDLSTRQTLGLPLNHTEQIKAMAFSPDGAWLYLITSTVTGGAVAAIRAIETAKLEQVVTRGQPPLQGLEALSLLKVNLNLTTPAESGPLAVAPDGSRLYVVIDHGPGNNGEVRIFDTATLQQVPGAIPVGKNPSAIALTPDGRWAVITNRGDNTVSLIETATKTPIGLIQVNQPPNLGQAPVAVAISPEGTRAYVANRGDGTHSNTTTLSVLDLSRRAIVKEIALLQPPVALALTPHGERIYVVTFDSLISLQVGARQPTEWNLTSGAVTPTCLPTPFHLAAALGSPSLPSALSQVVPVTEACAYDFSFWGIAQQPDAVAEVLWLNPDCGLIKTDPVPIQVSAPQPASLIAAHDPAAVPKPPSPQFGCFGTEPRLVLHRQRLTAPAGARQAEVRFTVPSDGCAAIDLVSLTATSETVANADFTLQEAGRLAGWTLSPGMAPGVAVLSAESGIELRNAGANLAELVQTVPVKGTQPFTLEFQGQVVAPLPTQATPRIELHWLKADGSTAGSPTTLEVLPTSFGSSVADGTTPAGATQAEIHLILPAGITEDVKRVSLRFPSRTLVPLTFVSQAPGELAISDLQVSYEEVAVSAPRVPQGGRLCTPTPPGRQPGETPHDRCFCSCCETEQTLTEAIPMVTDTGRPVLVGHCSNCDGEVVHFGGPLVPGAPAFSFARGPASQPIIIRPAISPREIPVETQPLPSAPAGLTPLTAVKGIGETRARQLAEIGIDSAEKLAAAKPEDVAQIPGIFSVDMATQLIGEANALVSSNKKP